MAGRAASQRSTGRRSRASNCHSISTGSCSLPGGSALESDTGAGYCGGPPPLPGDIAIAATRPERGGSLCAVARRTMTAELPSPTEIVQAAGGLVVRRHNGLLQIVVVHRPVQQDWSFPKGKLATGETFELAALREVHEETGMACRLLRFIGHTEYLDRKGRPKAVAYWVMAAESGFFTPNEEVDELLWLNLESAARLLSYPRDWELVAVLSAADQVEPLI